MTEPELQAKLEELLSLPSENEVVEFKEAKTSYDIEKLGQYFSALSNEANLAGRPCAWLVFGVVDKTHEIIGSTFKQQGVELNKLKKVIADKTTNRIGFQGVYDLKVNSKRVVMFQIPSAPAGLPMAFDGHYYGRDHESIVALNSEKYERIRTQSSPDWSSEIVTDASIVDLDEEAVSKAKFEFLRRNPQKKDDLEDWSDHKFLDKAKLTRNGRITRTTILLLGKEESEHFLGSCDAKIRWVLKNSFGETEGSEIICLPMLLAIDKVYLKIRNIEYRYAKEGTLFPEKLLRYDPFNIREPLNNCIAHRDYALSGRINVVEFENEKLVFSNVGTFIPGSVERVVKRDTPEERYRNTFLVEAMRNLNMVETEGGGIKKVFKNQKERFFPLPEYEFTDGKVTVTIQGKVLDMEFARILAQNQALTLDDIMLLDKVQKRKAVTKSELQYLRLGGFIEGRNPNIFLSFHVVKPIPSDKLKVDYMNNKGLDDKYIRKMILDYLRQFPNSKKNTLETLLIPKMSSLLNEQKKKKKISNLLFALKMKGLITVNNSYEWSLG